ncbi:3-hydroxyacyl-ACP dehydratase [Ancylomarina euxinus]|uniref:3-hydroxyacyl-ACP dehydratase n=1 Tax=Ancylomarina euxinus TaxID=2283627 RepID=A0A425Y8W2_9BACT|nr:acyl-CoA dehydratase activase [Ancylomarina euxinus]MCZ4693353.1 acyl-CoA dehydratase activase [Ancylomarina euxinus]MUP13581.1 3-hydroxyacyl-ACP dehydratase [Ancylomarina euxinus]RRG24772.1 3-hydroxyacyl-ACP dehydratase [Ancylomarina euxinus]
MKLAGIDIGSRSIELIVLKDGHVIHSKQADSGYNPIERVKELTSGISFDKIMATGYGRSIVEVAFDYPTVTEIKAYGAGATALFPGVRSVLDIGGQDTKVISINENGKVVKFEMNDKCAAGTGKFLEMMATTLGFELPSLGAAALEGTEGIEINSMCAVFAESEVTSLLAKGCQRSDIALAIHQSVCRRAVGMLRRQNISTPLMFAGGVANNSCMIQLLQEALGQNIIIPTNPQFVGAHGAAILAGLS